MSVQVVEPWQIALLKQLQMCADVVTRVDLKADADENDGSEQQQRNVRQTQGANLGPEQEPARRTCAPVITDPRLISAGGTQMKCK